MTGGILVQDTRASEVDTVHTKPTRFPLRRSRWTPKAVSFTSDGHFNMVGRLIVGLLSWWFSNKVLYRKLYMNTCQTTSSNKGNNFQYQVVDGEV